MQLKKVAEPDAWMMQISASDLEFAVWTTFSFQIHLTIVMLSDWGLDICFMNYTRCCKKNGLVKDYVSQEKGLEFRLQTWRQICLDVFCYQYGGSW